MVGCRLCIPKQSAPIDWNGLSVWEVSINLIDFGRTIPGTSMQKLESWLPLKMRRHGKRHPSKLGSCDPSILKGWSLVAPDSISLKLWFGHVHGFSFKWSWLLVHGPHSLRNITSILKLSVYNHVPRVVGFDAFSYMGRFLFFAPRGQRVSCWWWWCDPIRRKSTTAAKCEVGCFVSGRKRSLGSNEKRGGMNFGFKQMEGKKQSVGGMVLTCFQGELVITKWLLLEKRVSSIFLHWRGYLTGLAKGLYIVVRVALVMLESWKCRQKTDFPLHLHDKTLHFLFDRKKHGFRISFHAFPIIFAHIQLKKIEHSGNSEKFQKFASIKKNHQGSKPTKKKMGRFYFISEFCSKHRGRLLEIGGQRQVGEFFAASSWRETQRGRPFAVSETVLQNSSWYGMWLVGLIVFISKVNGEDWDWTSWWCSCELSSQEDMIILKPLFCKSHVHSKVASLVDWWGNQPRTGGPIFGQWTCRLLKNLPNVSRKLLEEANLLQGLGSCNREDQHPVLAKVNWVFRLSIRLL